MPHDPLKHEMLQRQINNPDNWLMGEVSGGPGRIASKVVQSLPTARDATQLISRLQGTISQIPTSAKKLLSDVPMTQSVKDMMHPSAMQMQEKMFQQANPVFRKMVEMGLFDRFK